MSLEHKTFAMSMYANAESLFRAKAEHYEREAEKLQMELTVALERLSHLEKHLVKVDRQNEKLGEQNDRLERLLSRHEAG